MTNQPMNTEELIEAVRQWGIAKGITGPNGKGTLLGQLSKTAEELTETRDAAVKLDYIKAFGEMGFNVDLQMQAGRVLLEDGIGDCAVTLVLAAEMAGLRFEDCLQAAYDEIKGRTGSMQGGVFVKDKP
jgi:NTP pyrophosphatase (non-canonical NTP hydrolase)